LGEAVEAMEKDSREDTILTEKDSKKLDFMRAKEKQYKAALEKEEGLLFKLTGGDTSLKHSRVEALDAELTQVEKEMDEASRQMTGYHNLPPSCQLARNEYFQNHIFG